MTFSKDDLLLYRDLCYRIPCGTYVRIYSTKDPKKWSIKHLTPKILSDYFKKDIVIKPYLREMSEMTTIEENCLEELLLKSPITDQEIVKIDYYNSKKLDYRNLIGKGLAYKHPKYMYKL